MHFNNYIYNVKLVHNTEIRLITKITDTVQCWHLANNSKVPVAVFHILQKVQIGKEEIIFLDLQIAPKSVPSTPLPNISQTFIHNFLSNLVNRRKNNQATKWKHFLLRRVIIWFHLVQSSSALIGKLGTNLPLSLWPSYVVISVQMTTTVYYCCELNILSQCQ